MNCPATIHFRDLQWWAAEQTTYVRGSAFDGPTRLDSRGLAVRFAAVAGRDEFIALLARLNGFFAVVQLVGGEYRLGVDRVRSIPLFYGIRNEQVWISDDCYWVEQHAGSGEWSDVAQAEYLHLGYVTGRDTLCPEVKQCLAGEVVFVEAVHGETKCTPCRYYRYKHEKPDERSTTELVVKHENVLDGVFRRLITIADGRTIVIPLSGGYDSRLIALMLRKLEYTKVIAFSYGRPGNWEAETSSRVATDLGFDWKFVPYSNEAWANWYHSNECAAYQRYNGTLVSLAHIQDWPAVWQLTQQGDIPPDSLVVPGHTGDFIAGGRSTSAPKLYTTKSIIPGHIVDASIKYHYTLKANHITDDPMWSHVVDRLRRQTNDIISDSAENSASVFETWNWENRQAKFIVNSVRAYEFYNLSWWLPLWDSQYMDFWARMPLKHRFEKRFYDSFVDNLYQQVAGKRAPQQQYVPVMTRIKLQLRRFAVLRAIRRMMPKTLKPTDVYENHPHCAYGIMSMEQFESLFTGGQTRLTFRAAEVLGDIVIRKPRDCGSGPISMR